MSKCFSFGLLVFLSKELLYMDKKGTAVTKKDVEEHNKFNEAHNRWADLLYLRDEKWRTKGIMTA